MNFCIVFFYVGETTISYEEERNGRLAILDNFGKFANLLVLREICKRKISDFSFEVSCCVCFTN